VAPKIGSRGSSRAGEEAHDQRLFCDNSDRRFPEGTLIRHGEHLGRNPYEFSRSSHSVTRNHHPLDVEITLIQACDLRCHQGVHPIFRIMLARPSIRARVCLVEQASEGWHAGRLSKP
jgi:hypothetical protein